MKVIGLKLSLIRDKVLKEDEEDEEAEEWLSSNWATFTLLSDTYGLCA